MELSSSKDSKIAEIEMISMLSTKCSSENFEFVIFMVWFGTASSTVR